MDNWVKIFLKQLFDLGYFDKNITELLAVDGTGGINTTNAFNRAKKDGYRWDSNKKELYKVNESENSVIEDYNYFRPSKTSGICVDKECAGFVNDELRSFYETTDLGGDAWLNLIYSNADSRFSGMIGLNTSTTKNQYNKQAADRFRQILDTLQLDTKLPYITNMYHKGSRAVNKAWKNAWNVSGIGRTTGTHSGITWWDPKTKTWMLTHNVGTIETRPFKHYLYESLKNRPIAMGAYGYYTPNINYDLQFSNIDWDTQSTLPFEKLDLFETPKYSKELNFNFDKIYEYITNGKKMFEDYSNGVEDLELLNNLHIYPNGELNRYGNILSPLTILSLEFAKSQGDKIQTAYNLPSNIFLSFFPLTLGILWKESNGGSNVYMSSNGLLKNKTYDIKHLSTPYYLIRSLGSKLLPNKEMSTTSGSVKLNDVPLTFNRNFLTNPLASLDNKTRLVAENMYGGVNIMSKMANNYVKLHNMLGNNANVLYNENGGLSEIGSALLLEAHNLGLDSGIKKSIEKYLETNDIDYLAQYLYHESARKLHPKDLDNRPSYGRIIYNTLKQGFNNLSIPATQLPELIVNSR